MENGNLPPTLYLGTLFADENLGGGVYPVFTYFLCACRFLTIKFYSPETRVI